MRQLEDPDAFIAQGGPAAARALYYHEAVLGRIDPDLLEQGVVSFIDDVPPSLRAAQQEQPQMKATSATDSDDEEDDEDNEEEDDDVRSDTTAAMRMKLQKRRERKAGALSDDSGAESNDDAAGSRAGSDMQPAAGAASRSNHKPPARRAVGDDEDAEIAVKPRAKLKVPKAPESDDYEDDEDEDENDHSKGRGVSSSAPHDASPASAAEAAAAAAAAAIAAQQAQQQPRDAERHGLDSELSFSSAAARVTGAGRPSTPGRTGRQSQPSFFDQALAQWTETVKSDAANATAQNKAHEEDPRLQQQEVLSPGQASPLPSGPDGRRRPLPSQQKCLPTSTEGMEAALKQAELTLVWAPSQAERSAVSAAAVLCLGSLWAWPQEQLHVSMHQERESVWGGFWFTAGLVHVHVGAQRLMRSENLFLRAYFMYAYSCAHSCLHIR